MDSEKAKDPIAEVRREIEIEASKPIVGGDKTGELPEFQTFDEKLKASKPHLSRITIGRLFNLGNYEHIRYEVAVDVPAGTDIAKLLTNLHSIFGGLRPIKKSWEVENAIRSFQMGDLRNAEEMRQWDETYRGIYDAYQARLKHREEALKLFEDLGGSSIQKDAKLSWEDEYED